MLPYLQPVTYPESGISSMLVIFISLLPIILCRNPALTGYTARRSLLEDPSGWKLLRPCQGSRRICSSQNVFLVGKKLSCFGMITLATVCQGYLSSSHIVPEYSTGWSSRFSQNCTWKKYSASCFA